MRPPSGELTAAGSGGVSAVAVIATARSYGIELDPVLAGWLALAASWVGAWVRRRFTGTEGRHGARRDDAQ